MCSGVGCRAGESIPLQGAASGWERVGGAGLGAQRDTGLWIQDARLRIRDAILLGAASRCWGWSRGGLGRGVAIADGRRVAAYKYLPGSEEEVGGLSSSLNEINGSEA